jgi:lipopolysaccharide heptosyltransferase II
VNAARWQQARKVLCVRLDALGDVLMCTPALRAVKHGAPRRLVTLLSSAAGVAAARYIPELDGALAYRAPWVKHNGPACAMEDADTITRIAARQFDAAVIFTSYSQSALPAALLCHLAGIPLRIAHCRENPYHVLTDWVAEPEPERMIRHEVQRQLDLVASLGWQTADNRLSFAVPATAMAQAGQLLAKRGIASGEPFIVLHPGASAPSRRYPAHLWAQVVAALSGLACGAIVLTGDTAEIALADEIAMAAGVPVISLAGQLDLGQLGAVIARAAVVLCNNTDPAHMAAALGTPVVTLYALTNPQHTPWQVPQRVLFHDVGCRFCYKSVCPEGHHDCLAKVDPARVVHAVASLLAEPASRLADSARWRP